ncbi:putative serine protease K12H4.7 [Calliopsis andreniformis]|uniref:putative serine protease K12H4.7 n=1 Tax=Calliopsis andreniformis TaxID=337506 RepID=UPI003FCDFBC1
MMFLSFLLMVSLTCHVGSGVNLHRLRFRGLEDPETSNRFRSEDIKEDWIVQPLDNFNAQDNRTWLMRYLENDEHFKEGGPIFIMIGGEWSISKGYLQGGLMYELAVDHNAMMYYTEHRYYGKSRPTEDITSENLQYLSVDQALADLANFIEAKKKEERLQNSKVIVFGGSYAGNVVTWLRLKYPHLVQGALASSAPVFAKADFHEYYEVVTQSIGEYSEKCVDSIKAAFQAVEELLATPDGPKKLKRYFNLCNVPNVKSPSDVGFLMNTLAEAFAGIVQYDKVQNGKTQIAACCEDMTASYLGSPLQRLAAFVSRGDMCLDNNYEKFIKTYSNGALNEEKDITRLWFYQTCTEYGYYQTSNSTKSIFGTLFPLSFFTELCMDLYGDYYDGDFLNTRVERTNLMYGGLRPDLRNVIFTNGNIDPWHALSILEDLNESSPAIFIKGSSHCRDLQNDLDTDSPDLTQARKKVRQIISSWVVS